jgi:hypothetical protein
MAGAKGDLRTDLVRLPAWLIVEEGLYVRGAAPGTGYRNG